MFSYATFASQDGFTVQIVDWARFDEAQELLLVRRREGPAGSNSFGLGADIAVTLKDQYVSMSSCEEIGTGRMCTPRQGSCLPLCAFLRRSGVPCMDAALVPVLLLPEPVCALALLGQWSQILLLARWCNGWPWQEWPVHAWTSAVIGQHASVQTLAKTSLDLQKLQQVGQQVRRLGSIILSVFKHFVNFGLNIYIYSCI